MTRSGDKAELSRLVLEHMEDALRLATRLCGDPHEAEDVVQEALYRAARGWKSFRGESRFRTWLFRIVVNAFRDARRARRVAGVLPVDIPDRRLDQSAATQAQELEAQVAACVDRLPPRQREIVLLRIVEELSVAEVAEILKTNEPNVYATLHAARKRLKEMLASSLDEVKRR